MPPLICAPIHVPSGVPNSTCEKRLPVTLRIAALTKPSVVMKRTRIEVILCLCGLREGEAGHIGYRGHNGAEGLAGRGGNGAIGVGVRGGQGCGRSTYGC